MSAADISEFNRLHSMALRCTARAYRLEARACLVDPMIQESERKSRVDHNLQLAASYDRMADDAQRRAS